LIEGFDAYFRAVENPPGSPFLPLQAYAGNY